MAPFRDAPIVRCNIVSAALAVAVPGTGLHPAHMADGAAETFAQLPTSKHSGFQELTSRRSRSAILFLLGLAALAAGCSSRPYGNLVVGAGAPDAGRVDMLVATTRAAVSEPPGVIFGGARGSGLDFANIVISKPGGQRTDARGRPVALLAARRPGAELRYASRRSC